VSSVTNVPPEATNVIAIAERASVSHSPLVPTVGYGLGYPRESIEIPSGLQCRHDRSEFFAQRGGFLRWSGHGLGLQLFGQTNLPPDLKVVDAAAVPNATAVL
jgi:hypothetical protein